jgi:hypothetical protein
LSVALFKGNLKYTETEIKGMAVGAANTPPE